MRMPPLPADSIHARACKLKCEKILTRPYCLVKLMRQAAFLACPVKLKERGVPIGTPLSLSCYIKCSRSRIIARRILCKNCNLYFIFFTWGSGIIKFIPEIIIIFCTHARIVSIQIIPYDPRASNFIINYNTFCSNIFHFTGSVNRKCDCYFSISRWYYIYIITHNLFTRSVCRL